MTEATKGEAPSDLITAVVNLVGTGPVPLGAYTPAEITAVGGLISWLERDPGPESMAEAVRSLAARDLITTEAGDEHIEVRGDLGIALAFQQRARVVLDARLTGTEPDTPWRFLLMPQPEQITLEVRIDALGITSTHCARPVRRCGGSASNYPAGRKALPPPTSIRLSPRAPRRRS